VIDFVEPSSAPNRREACGLQTHRVVHHRIRCRRFWFSGQSVTRALRITMRTLVLILLSTVGSLLASDLPLTVEDSGSPEVDALVLQLVSSRPAPYPSGSSRMMVKADWGVPYMTPQVSNAIVKLKAMGTAIFPALVKHLSDDRYSFSDISAAWGNLTVGDAVVNVLSDGHYMVSGYKFRKTPSGSAVYLSFKDYLDARGPEKWSGWAKNKSRLDIQLDFIDWCTSKEQERGFTDEAQRKGVLGRYARAREEVRKEYSEPDGAAKRSQPIRSETNRTSSAAGSRR